MRHLRPGASLVLGAVLVVALSACGSSGGGGTSGNTGTTTSVTKLSVPSLSVSASQGALQYTIAKGYFTKNHLSVTTPLSSEGPLKASIVAGSVDFDQLAGGDLLGLYAKKVGVTAIACTATNTGYYVYARKGTADLAALKGKSVGVPSLGGAPQIAMEHYLTTKGLAADSVKFVALGSIPNVLTALTSGKIDSGLLSTPFNFRADAAGLPDLGYATGPPTPYIVDTSWAKKHPAVVTNILKSLVEGAWAYQTHESDGITVLGKFLKLDPTVAKNKATLSKSFAAYLPPVQAPPGRCSAADFAPFVAYLPKAQQTALPALAPLFDNSYVNSLNRTGFYTQVQTKYGPLPENTTLAHVLR